MTETCKTCKFWIAYKLPKDRGECRRHPPKASKDLERGRFPMVHDTDWCGEHQGAESAP